MAGSQCWKHSCRMPHLVLSQSEGRSCIHTAASLSELPADKSTTFYQLVCKLILNIGSFHILPTVNHESLVKGQGSRSHNT